MRTISTTRLALDRHNKNTFWTLADKWRTKRMHLGCHLFPEQFREAVVVPAANELEAYIEQLINEAFRLGKESRE